MTCALLLQWEILEQVLLLKSISEGKGATGQTEVLSIGATKPQEVAVAAEAKEVAVSLFEGIFSLGEGVQIVKFGAVAATPEPVSRDEKVMM